MYMEKLVDEVGNEMDKEKKFFLQVLADYLNKRETVMPEAINWDMLWEIALSQQLTGVVYHQCKNGIARSDLPDAIKNRWKQGYKYYSLLYLKRLALLKQVDTAFQKANIPYLIFKGTELAKLYPTPAQRTMGDSDILVHEEDKQRASEALVSLGFELDTHLPVEWFAQKDEIKIELHHRLIYNYHSVEINSLQAWGDKVWENVAERKERVQKYLDLTYHMVYVLLHLRKHLLMEGIGFRQFMDVAVLAAQPGISWPQANLWLKELHLEKFSRVCFTLCKRWFDIKLPVKEVEIQEAFYNETTEKIMSGGVFGYHGDDEKEQRENVVLNEAHFTQSSGTYSFFKRIFLPYNVMRGIPYCKFLDGRSYLLPIAWCWRCLYILCTKNPVPYLKGAYDKETKRKKEEMLMKWGL